MPTPGRAAVREDASSAPLAGVFTVPTGAAPQAFRPSRARAPCGCGGHGPRAAATTPPSDEGNAMAKITYKHPDGTATVVDVHAPDTVMRGAKLNGVDGIEAQCGGAAQCGTCHVYVDPAGAVPLPAMDEVEDDVLYTTASPRTAHSRLSCQLPVTEAMDGLVVHLPERQT